MKVPGLTILGKNYSADQLSFRLRALPNIGDSVIVRGGKTANVTGVLIDCRDVRNAPVATISVDDGRDVDLADIQRATPPRKKPGTILVEDDKVLFVATCCDHVIEIQNNMGIRGLQDFGLLGSKNPADELRRGIRVAPQAGEFYVTHTSEGWRLDGIVVSRRANEFDLKTARAVIANAEPLSSPTMG